MRKHIYHVFHDMNVLSRAVYLHTTLLCRWCTYFYGGKYFYPVELVAMWPYSTDIPTYKYLRVHNGETPWEIRRKYP